MALRKDLPYQALKRMEAVALGQFDAMLERGVALIGNLILESPPDPEELTAAEASFALSKSAQASLQPAFSQEVLHFYAFGIPKELELAAEEARSHSLEDFLVLASGQAGRQEVEATRTAENQERRRADLWIALYNQFRSSGMKIDLARKEVDKTPAYIRAKALSDQALVIKERVQDGWETLRRAFKERWDSGLESAQKKGVAVPEGLDQLALFWSVANNR